MLLMYILLKIYTLVWECVSSVQHVHTRVYCAVYMCVSEQDGVTTSTAYGLSLVGGPRRA